MKPLIHHRVPLVTMDRGLVGPGLSDVSINYSSGMIQAVEHLKQFRHKKIGYIGGSAGLTISDHRVKAFVGAIRKAGLTVDPNFIRAGNYRITGGEAAMAELLALKNRPTAILAANDLTAIGALRVIRQQNFSVPHDFSIVGFDDIELSDIVYPPLTTIRLPRQELAEMFFKALESSGRDPHAMGKQYGIKTSLVVRSSTGPVRKAK